MYGSVPHTARDSSIGLGQPRRQRAKQADAVGRRGRQSIAIARHQPKARIDSVDDGVDDLVAQRVVDLVARIGSGSTEQCGAKAGEDVGECHAGFPNAGGQDTTARTDRKR